MMLHACMSRPQLNGRHISHLIHPGAGPKASLDDTVNSQPALFVAGLAAVEKLRAENHSMVESASACAGLSLGEYCALVFAGALSFEDGLKVVRVRAQSMAAAAKQGQHGMLSVVGVADAELEAICANVVKSGAPGCVGCGDLHRCTGELTSQPVCLPPGPCAASPTTCSPRAASCRATRPPWRRCRRRRRRLAL